MAKGKPQEQHPTNPATAGSARVELTAKGPAPRPGASPQIADPADLHSWAELGAAQNAKRVDPCEVYIQKLHLSVRARLTALLQGPSAICGHNMEGELEAQQALPIRAKPEGLQTFKEQWNWANCAHILSTQGLYEAPGDAFWLRLDVRKWEGSQLPACNLTYGNIAAGRQMWSDDRYARSAIDDPSKRHHLINGVLPAAVESEAEATEKLRSAP